jgi:hypothetical protein
VHPLAKCLRDTSTDDYDLRDLLETDVSVGSFSVSGANCAVGYSGMVTYTPCETSDGVADLTPDSTYVGCFVNSGRGWSKAGSVGLSSSYEACATFCEEYTYMGMHWRNECRCSNEFTWEHLGAPGNDCGEFGELCGHGLNQCGWRFALHNIGAVPEGTILGSGEYSLGGCLGATS